MKPLTASERKAAQRRLGDADWRLRNLYWIRDESGRRLRFRPYAVQERLLRGLKRRCLVLKGRQMRVTTAFCLRWLDLALWKPDMKIGIVAHTKGDAARIFREKILFPYDQLPEAIRNANPCVKRTDSELVLANGSEISAGVTYRSGTLQVLHVTEYGYTCARQPLRAEEIRTGAMIAAQKGTIVVESTAMGRSGHFFELCQEGLKGASGWDFSFLPWYEEPSYAEEGDGPFAERRDGETDYLDRLEAGLGIKLSAGQRRWYCLQKRSLGEVMHAEFPSTAEEAFKASTEGAYYGRQMIEAWRAGRVTRVPVDPALLVETWWDIGYGDATAIWFAQRRGLEVRLVDYYENSGEGVAHYAQHVREWMREHGIRSVRCIGPHDLQQGRWSTGDSQLQTAAQHGLIFEVAPSKSVEDGIECVRRTLPLCVFDEERCASGIKALESYRKKWNEALGVWHGHPLHDWASNGADAFRTGATQGAEASVVTPAVRSAARAIQNVKWM